MQQGEGGCWVSLPESKQGLWRVPPSALPGWLQGRLPFPGKSSRPTPTARSWESQILDRHQVQCASSPHHSEWRKLITREPAPKSGSST